ncbi:type 2 isopentenyl-diphosphate Delta-isomerase [Nocardia goodfellowii]|uniref:Isopentenyl-diphosphate delta-isomerase n=1 Tax=Nocardia goodfellowii TaxID=882446 RepID=A0ABS4QKE6_9NOCA|nr:type 2 isopentenyl-diphosphate Delta-isomerase [Nocardia goodfellowii]MBP2191558.1 isopentenyl-diphosphate delta-isomerase [Nocardia goodfellowii]
MTSAHTIGNRKDDHLRYAVDQHHHGFDGNDFDSVRFVHHALAGIDRADVDLTVKVAGMRWATPLYINGMTGGSRRAGTVNRELAIAAAETGLPIASGSMSAFLRDRSLADTYRVLRREHPHGFVMANVNANITPEEARRAVDLLEADALQIHLNAIQEIIMPEGDRHFSHWPRRIEHIAASVGVPVIVKEVGFGLSRETIALLRDLGVAVADVGGRGGTDFAAIENSRRPGAELSFLEGWGQSTVCCLLEAAQVRGIEVVASGGVRSALDVARALALGASAAGVAGKFLSIVIDDGVDALIATIRKWLDQLTSIMTVLGTSTPADLARCDLLVGGNVSAYCGLREIESHTYARRSLASAASEFDPARGSDPKGGYPA